MTGAVLDRPAVLGDSGERSAGGRLTLEQRLSETLHAVRTAGSADCPICHARMKLTCAHAECDACGSRLS